MKYDFSHWDKLPKVVCACCTYGRENLLPEAVQCFLYQDYIGESHLVILNDQENIKYTFNHPKVTVINVDKRFDTIGEKRNVCSLTVDSDIILPWDDDDIHLPWRISITVDRMKNHHFWKGDRFWNLGKDVAKYRTPIPCNAPSMAGFSTELFKKVGGYNWMQAGEDGNLQEKFYRLGYKDIGHLNNNEVYYIYRSFESSGYHLTTTAYENIVVSKERKEIEIVPKLEKDYLKFVKFRK